MIRRPIHPSGAPAEMHTMCRMLQTPIISYGIPLKPFAQCLTHPNRPLGFTLVCNQPIGQGGTQHDRRPLDPSGAPAEMHTEASEASNTYQIS